MIEHVDDVAAAAAPGGRGALFAAAPRQTPWPHLDVLDLGSGAFHEVAGAGVESACLLLAGGLQLPTTVTAPEAVVGPAGADHTLRAGADGARLIVLGVRCGAGPPGEVRHQAFDRSCLRWQAAIHGGGGRIATRHLWGPDDFASSLTFIDHAVLSPGSWLGCHYHEHLEEMFVVLSGRGWMTIGDDTHPVGAGHVTFQRATVGHGLYNPFEVDLDFVRVAVAQPGETFTTVDLDVDLRQRRPAVPETTT